MSTLLPGDLSGRVVLVTGGTKGLGRAFAEAFLSAGADVLVCARNPPADPIEVAGGREAAFIDADVRDADQAGRCVDHAVEQFGRIDVVVNNAGGSPPADAATVSPRFVDKIVGLNLLAPFFVAQRANAAMQAQADGGVIINIGSVAGQRPAPGSAIYGAAKAGLAHLTTSLAMEWAPRVRVNCIVVGLLRTEQAHLHYGDEAGIVAVGQVVPMGRLVEPRDVVGTALFLASPAAAFVTGAVIDVHGGGERPAFLDAARLPAPPST